MKNKKGAGREGRGLAAGREPGKEVKDRLNKPGAGLSGGQQQRLCIARAIAVEPQVLLMDEPCSALDPISTLAIEDLITELKSSYTIVIVTHNMQQAARVSDRTAFFNLTSTGEPGATDRDGRQHRRRSSATRRSAPPRTTSPAVSAEPLSCWRPRGQLPAKRQIAPRTEASKGRAVSGRGSSPRRRGRPPDRRRGTSGPSRRRCSWPRPIGPRTVAWWRRRP